MENTSRNLSFPQRNWFLLCVIVAILSPLVVHWLGVGADKSNYDRALHSKPAGSDTSYKVATPPVSNPAGQAGATPGGAGGTPGTAPAPAGDSSAGAHK